MSTIFQIKKSIPPRQFVNGSLVLAALVFLVLYPGLNLTYPRLLPVEMKARAPHPDFVQYYVGSIVVRNGIWNSLYPIPRQEVYTQPPQFTPIFKTFLFNPSSADKNPAYYPVVNLPKASDCSPKLLAYLPEAADRFRYIYPPPTALVFFPLSFFSFKTAATLVWPTLGYWSYFLLIFCASRMHRLLRGGVSYTEGLIILAFVFMIYRGPVDYTSGNISPQLSGIIAFCAYSLMQRRLLAFSATVIPLILIKSLGLTWLPLVLLHRAYWRALIYLAVIGLLFNGIVLALAGPGVYVTFFALSSKILIPTGEGVVADLLYLFGIYPRTFYNLFNLVVLGLIYYGYWRQTRPGQASTSPERSQLVLAAVLAGTMGLFCTTNFSVWGSYCPNYLFFPFLGWIVQEGYLTTGKWRWFIFGVTFLSGAMFGGLWIIQGALYHLFGAASVAPFHNIINPLVTIIFLPIFFIIVALRRLLWDLPVRAA